MLCGNANEMSHIDTFGITNYGLSEQQDRSLPMHPVEDTMAVAVAIEGGGGGSSSNARQSEREPRGKKKLYQQISTDDNDSDDGDDEETAVSSVESGGPDEEEVVVAEGAEAALHVQAPDRTILHLVGINTFAFVYGLLIATFGLIVLPLESERLWPEKHALLLALFLAVCGISQLSGPLAGYGSDHCVHPWGRRRPYFACGAAVGIPSLLALRWASGHTNLTVYMIFFLLAMLALNVMYTAYSGALADLVNERQRGVATGLMGSFSVLGASTGFGCFSYFHLDLPTAYLFYVAVLLTAVAVSVVSYTETPLVRSEVPLWTWREIGECYWVNPVLHRDFFLVFVSRTLYYMGISVQTFMLFYFRDVIRSSDPAADVSYLALFGQLSGAAVCVPMGLLSDRVGRKALIYWSSGVIFAAYIGFMLCRTRYLAFAIGAVYGTGNGTYLSVDYALACDTLPSKDKAARYLGVWGVGAFLGTLFGSMLVGPSLLVFGDIGGNVDEDGAPSYGIAGYVVTLAVGCLCMLLSALTVSPVQSAR